MRTAGRFSNASSSDGDNRANSCTRTHEHTVSRPDFYKHAASYPDPDECAHFFAYGYTDFGALRNGHTHPDGHIDTYQHADVVSDSNLHTDTCSYDRTDSHKYIFSNTRTNRNECSNSHIDARDVGDILAYTRPHCYAPTHKLTYANTDGTTHGCPHRHAHAHADARSN